MHHQLYTILPELNVNIMVLSGVSNKIKIFSQQVKQKLQNKNKQTKQSKAQRNRGKKKSDYEQGEKRKRTLFVQNVTSHTHYLPRPTLLFSNK